MDYNSFPPEFRDRLAGLEQEYDEGELTKKGFEKKKNSLLEEFRQYKYIGGREENDVGTGSIGDMLGIGELSLSTTPSPQMVPTSSGDGGVSPTNSISSGNYYIHQDGSHSTNSNQYNLNQQQYGGYTGHSVQHSLASHVSNPPPPHHNSFLLHHQLPPRTINSDLRPDSVQINHTSISPNIPPSNPNTNHQIPTMNYRPPPPHLTNQYNHPFAPFGTASPPQFMPSGRPSLPPHGYPHNAGSLQYFPQNTGGYPIRPNRPHQMLPVRPTHPPYVGEIPPPGPIGRARQLVNENAIERARSISGGRSSLDISDTASIKGYTKSAGDYDYLPARVQDDNVSIRSGRSSIFTTSNSNGQRFDGMISPDDRPGRSVGNRISLYNSMIYSEILDPTLKFDPGLSKLGGLQFMPFEPRELTFENLDPLNPSMPLSNFTDIATLLRYRGQMTPKRKAFLVLDQKGREVHEWTWEKLHLRAEKMAQTISRDSGLMKGERVALIYRKAEILEFLVALYGCFFAGVVAVPINAVEEFKELLSILEKTGSKLALTTEHNHKVFTRDLLAQKKELPANVTWWRTNEYGALNLKKGDELGLINITELAYIECTKSPNGELKGVAISHQTIMAQCNIMRGSVTDTKMREYLNRRRPGHSQSPNDGDDGEMSDKVVDTVLSYLEPRQQVGLILGALWGVYCGNITIYLGSLGPDVPGLWVNCVSKYKVTIALADYPGLNPIVSSFRSDPSATLNFSKKQTPDLSSLRFLFIDTLTIDIQKNQEIIDQLLAPLGAQFPKDVLTPLSSLPEHGGMVLSFGDLLGVQGLDDRVEGERGVKEFLLDREELKENRVVVVGIGEDGNKQSVMRVGAFGFVMPEATIAVVDPETTALCLPNTVGEIWIDSPSLSGGFWDLPKHTESIFHARPIFVPGDTKQPEYFDQEFLRTGLLGSLINGQLVVFGLYEHRIRQLIEPVIKEMHKKLVVINRSEYDGESDEEEVSDDKKQDDEEKDKYKFHYTLDLENTVRRNIEGVYDCVVIEIYIKDQNLPVMIIESGLPIEKLTTLANDIYDKLVIYHELCLYTISICAQGSLPRSWRNGKKLINSINCKKGFEYGSLQVLHVKTCASETVFNIPIGEDIVTGIWGPNAMAARQEMSNGSMALRRAQYTRVDIPQEVLDEKTSINLLKFRSIVDVLLWRTQMSPEEAAYNILDMKGKEGKPISWKKLNNRIATVANYLQKKGCKAGDHTVLIFPHGIDFVCSIFACMVLGIIAIPISQTEPTKASEDIPALFGLVEDFKVSYLLVNTDTEQVLKGRQIQNFIKTMSGGSKQLSNNNNSKLLPPLINITKAPKYAKTLKESNYVMTEEWLQPQWPAVVMCYFSADQRRSCVRLNHDTLLALCKVQKETCRLTSTRVTLSCVRHFSGIGFVYTALIGIYLGSQTILISPLDYQANPSVWFETLSKFKIKDTYATFPMLQHAMSSFDNADYRSFSLQHLKNLMIPVECRPNANLYKETVKTFLANRLDEVAVNYVYSHIANPMITTRSYMCVEPFELYLDLKSLRRGVVKVVDPEDEPFGVLLHDSGMVPVSTQVAIVHPETRRPCLSNEFGEIWVSSDANANSSYGSMDPLDRERYFAVIDGGDLRMTYLRTGDLGFLYTIHKPGEGGTLVEFQCLFVLGPIAETFEVNGLIHFPVDIEFTVERCHQVNNYSLIAPNGCVIFQANGESICLVEVRSTDGILNLVSCIMNSILDDHQFIIDVIVFIGPGTLPKSRLGEKQRTKIMTSWLNGSLSTLHVHYVKPPLSNSRPTSYYLPLPYTMNSQQLITTNPSPSPTLDPTQYSITNSPVMPPDNVVEGLNINNRSNSQEPIQNNTNSYQINVNANGFI